MIIHKGLIPWPPTLLYYGIFFVFGSLCYNREVFEINSEMVADILTAGSSSLFGRDALF